jgi:putative Holliday junction resolvase
MRILGVDLGAKRIGLAITDMSATLARPCHTIAAGDTPRASAAAVAGFIAAPPQDAEIEPGSVEAIVVGVPRRLGGDPTHLTQAAVEFARVLSALTGRAVHMQDERLTSHEAESRLAETERDWRKRKARIDAAAAAIILQDYLDGRADALARESAGRT